MIGMVGRDHLRIVISGALESNRITASTTELFDFCAKKDFDKSLFSEEKSKTFGLGAKWLYIRGRIGMNLRGHLGNCLL